VCVYYWNPGRKLPQLTQHPIGLDAHISWQFYDQIIWQRSLFYDGVCLQQLFGVSNIMLWVYSVSDRVSFFKFICLLIKYVFRLSASELSSVDLRLAEQLIRIYVVALCRWCIQVLFSILFTVIGCHAPANSQQPQPYNAHGHSHQTYLCGNLSTNMWMTTSCSIYFHIIVKHITVFLNLHIIQNA